MNKEVNAQAIEEKYRLFKPFLNERTRRLWSAVEAKALGSGGIQFLSRITGQSRTTITRGIKELETGELVESQNRIRKEGGGRKGALEKSPEIEKALLQLIEPTVRGEPESPLLWTTKSLRNLADELKKQNYSISHTLVGQILKDNDFSLQANRKTDEGKSHPDRDSQFNYIHQKVITFQKAHNPVISVDAKKKELIGNHKNSGVEWQEKKNPVQVKVYDFLSEAKGKVTPYGVYDIANNKGWVNVGIDRDTSEFAVQTIRNWWYQMGKGLYPQAQELLITADSGGSNGARVRLWKKELQTLSNEIHLSISVCHFPPGTSKWNKIEHRLFSYITKNWRGRPLISYEVIVNLIAGTKTKKGLETKCELDRKSYAKGRKVTDKELSAINLLREAFHGDWNYSIRPVASVNV
jgi:DNA-binding transcriptional ArsR family regulator